MPDCGVHYLWFAFVCFLIRSHPPSSDWAKIFSAPSANQQFSLVPLAPLSSGQKFSLAPLKTQHYGEWAGPLPSKEPWGGGGGCLVVMRDPRG